MLILKLIQLAAFICIISGFVCVCYGASEIPVSVPATYYDANHPFPTNTNEFENDLRDYVQKSEGYKLLIIGAKVFGSGIALVCLLCLICAKSQCNKIADDPDTAPVTAPATAPVTTVPVRKKTVLINSIPETIPTTTDALSAHSASAVATYIEETQDPVKRYIFHSKRQPAIVEII
jgi:hypothetical protein